MRGNRKQEILEKVAKLRMRDVEADLGFYLDKKHHPSVRKEIDTRNQRSFALRHPYLTGIPTLGLAPLIAKSRASEAVIAKLLRNHSGLRKHHEKVQDRREVREIERARADAPVRATRVAAAALAAHARASRS